MATQTEVVNQMKPESPAGDTAQALPTEQAGNAEANNLTGRSVFVVQTMDQGVMVRSAFLTEDNRLLDMPAIFPELMYALNVVDDLKRQITEQFAQAAQVGARVIADQVRAQQVASQSVEQPMAVVSDASMAVGGVSNADAGAGSGATFDTRKK